MSTHIWCTVDFCLQKDLKFDLCALFFINDLLEITNLLSRCSNAAPPRPFVALVPSPRVWRGLFSWCLAVLMNLIKEWKRIPASLYGVFVNAYKHTNTRSCRCLSCSCACKTVLLIKRVYISTHHALTHSHTHTHSCQPVCVCRLHRRVFHVTV